MEPTIGPIPIRGEVPAWRIAAQAKGRATLFARSIRRLPIHSDYPTAPDDAPTAVVVNGFGPQCGSPV